MAIRTALLLRNTNLKDFAPATREGGMSLSRPAASRRVGNDRRRNRLRHGRSRAPARVDNVDRAIHGTPPAAHTSRKTVAAEGGQRQPPLVQTRQTSRPASRRTAQRVIDTHEPLSAWRRSNRTGDKSPTKPRRQLALQNISLQLKPSPVAITATAPSPPPAPAANRPLPRHVRNAAPVGRNTGRRRVS